MRFSRSCLTFILIMLTNVLCAQHISNIIKGERPVINLHNVPYSAFEPGKVSVKLSELSRAAITINSNALT